MKKIGTKNILQKARYSVAALALSAPLALSSAAFADNPYGIVYSGGEELGPSNVVSDAELLDSLSLAAGSTHDEDVVINFSDSSKWQTLYSGESCTPVTVLKVQKDATTNYFDGLYYTITNGKYRLKIDINNVAVEDIDSALQDGQYIGVAIGTDGFISALRGPYYRDTACEEQVDDIIKFNFASNVRAFIDTTIKLYHNDSDELYVSDQLYAGLTDIDGAQSYKILNSGNKLTADKMIARDAEKLQPTESDAKNMFVASGNYIYATGSFNISTSDNNIYIKLTSEAQQEGLNVVFGFATAATAGVEYYAKTYDVKYESDAEGEITGITFEDLISGDNPSGTIASPNESFVFSHWVADVNVTLVDGTTIEAGDPISPEQIKLVIVDNNITFTANYNEKEATPEKSDDSDEEIAVPNTGSMPEGFNGVAATISIIGVLIVATIAGLMPRFIHKKVKFNH